MSDKSRRDFLKYLSWGLAGSATSMSDLFLKNIVDGFSYQAFAETQGFSDPRVYLAITANGAPARWMWDQMLNPNGETIISNPNVATHFGDTGSRYETPIYGSVQKKGITVPHLWNYNVPKVGGGLRPMSDLLDYMLVLRGVDVLDAGHPGAQKKLFMMPGHPYSLQGAIADHSKTTLPSIAVSSGDTFDFVSKKGHQLVSVGAGTSNYLDGLLQPFQSNETLESRQIASANSIEIHRAINKLSARTGDYSSTLRDNLKNADELVRAGVGNLATEWSALLTKYDDLIDRALRGTVYPGINDKPVGTLATRDNSYRIDSSNTSGGTGIVNHNDLRSMITSQTHMSETAKQFAMAEFMVTRGYTNSVTIDLKPIRSLSWDSANSANLKAFVHDQHFTGNIITTFLSPFMFSALSACLIELIERLRATTRSNGKNLFDETVVQFTGEFNRTAPSATGGTDHAPSASSFTQWSGSFNPTPTVIGNILDLPSVGSGLGTSGLGAKISNYNYQTALTGNVLTSMAQFLRVPAQSPNNEAMAVISPGGGVTSLIGPPTMIPIGQNGQ